MFKPGDAAVVREDGQVVVERTFLGEGAPWRVVASGAEYDEADLHVATKPDLEGDDSDPDDFQSTDDPFADAKRLIRRFSGARDEDEEADQPDVSAIVKSLKRTTFDKASGSRVFGWNGHFKGGDAVRKEFLSSVMKTLYMSPWDVSKQDAKDLHSAIKSDHPLERFVPVRIRIDLRDCSCCGEKSLGLETDGHMLRFSGPPCAYPDGLPVTEWELNVPSGQIVVANDLRELFPVDDDFDVCTTIGCHRTTLAYAEAGMSHAYVGNSCPGVYLCKDGTYKIANPPAGGKDDPSFEGDCVAGVTTDLWWYSMCDREEFRRRCKRFKVKTSDFSHTVVRVEPGVYRFRHHNDLDIDYGPEIVYARFAKVRDPDPVKDLLLTYESMDVTPNAYVQAMAAKWPTLFGKADKREKPTPWADMSEKEQFSSWLGVANHMMCSSGGVEWHERGFPKAVVPAAPDNAPPAFRDQFGWTWFTKPYAGLFQDLSPSFAKFAFRVLESIISFGMRDQGGESRTSEKRVQDCMLLAATRYRELAAKHPASADPEYVAWLSQDGRAEAWISGFFKKARRVRKAKATG